MKSNYIEVEQGKKHIDIIMCMSFIITILVIIIIGSIITVAVEDKIDTEYIANNYIKPTTDFVSENAEKMQYAVLTIAFPIIYIAIYLLLKKCNVELKDYKLTYNVFLIINLIAIVGLLLIAIGSGINGLFYKINAKTIIVSIFWLGLIILNSKLRKKRKVIKYLTYIINLVVICIVSYLYVNSTFEQLRYVSHHVDAYYYPILKITSGLTPYVDFSPLYGCYSYIFALLQNIFNNNSFLFFSIINAVLVAITLINLTIVVNKMIKNKVIALITNLSIIFCLILQCFLTNEGPYLQYMPHRVLFVSIILLFITIYLKHNNTRRKNILQLIGFLICAFSIFWNIETGFIVLIVWTAFLGYEILFYNSLKDKKTYLLLLKLILMCIVTIISTCITIALITYIRTGEILNLKNVIASQVLFYKDGFYMIRMTFEKPWVLLIYIYAIGLVISLRKLYFVNSDKRINFKRYSMIFALCILGMGIFSYYQGRSHDHVYMSVIYPCILLVGIFTEKLLKTEKFVKSKNLHISNTIILGINICLLSVLASSSVVALINSNIIKTYMNKEKLNHVRGINLIDFSNYDTSNMDFILEYESLYYLKYDLKDEKKFPAKVDLFTYDDCKKILEYMKLTNKDIAIDKQIYILLNYKYAIQEDIELKNKFEIREDNGCVVLLNKNKKEK